MKNKQITIFFSVIIILVFGAVITFLSQKDSHKVVGGRYDDFATCLKDKGAVFYGAFWCPHCNNQKILFGSSENLVPYVECSTPDGRGQEQVCADKKITGYPTWEFADGTRLTGEVPFETLAQKTSCELPK